MAGRASGFLISKTMAHIYYNTYFLKKQVASESFKFLENYLEK